MILQDKVKYVSEFNKSIQYLENLGFENIKADIDGYETPKSYKKKDSNISFTPDIMAEKVGTTHIFDLSLKSEEPRLLKSKWLFLKSLSQLKSYRFSLITTRGHIKFSQDAIDELNLNTERLIKI